MFSARRLITVAATVAGLAGSLGATGLTVQAATAHPSTTAAPAWQGHDHDGWWRHRDWCFHHDRGHFHECEHDWWR